jgi:hypothetical protein
MSIQPAFDFDGQTYDPKLDRVRLNAQLKRVINVMRDGDWLMLSTISVRSGDPEASCSSRLRDLRKARFGASTVERKRSSYIGGTWLYRLILSEATRKAIDE